ncbi:hypothetical protein CLV43_109466 [Umezawaea tangerina]|uniref:Uncharacterized protein n=1 Tax=Umezawaea tangerina TaxID=84725 RepID=A0A2T0SXV8_9PSEU|nr:hypothetical protein CLV43_109466 [Umezawaea tangerina]
MRACASGDSGRFGESTRSTSAPGSANVHVATGPAITLVRSSTRTPSAGSSALRSTLPAPCPLLSTSGCLVPDMPTATANSPTA